MKSIVTDVIGLAGYGLLTAGFYLQFGLAPALMFSGGLLLVPFSACLAARCRHGQSHS